MKGQFKGFVVGLLIGAFVLSGIVAVATDGLRTLENVKVGGIRIVIDNKEFTCTDANGAVVEPMIYNGTTYIPVRAVSTAFGKAVYWDGEESTVYLGNMNGKLEKPTAKFKDLTNIAGDTDALDTKKNVKDNRENFYDLARVVGAFDDENDCCEFMLGKKYSKFKATLFVANGSTWSGSVNMTIVGDEKIIYKSEDFKKTSDPIEIEVDITNVDNFKILFSGEQKLYIAHEGFYQ